MTQHSVWKFSLPMAALFALLPAGLAAQDTAAENPRPISPAAASLPAPGLTLQQLQQMAQANNPTLAQARAGVEAAAGRTRQAALLPNPIIGYIGEEIRGGSYGGGQQGVFVQQNVILGGKLGLDQKIFAVEGQQAQAEAEEQRLRVENGVRIAFYHSLAAQQMIETRNKLSALAADAVETTRQLFNVGQADQPDLLQAQVEADEAALAVTMAQQKQQRAWRVLAALVGKPELALAPLQGNLQDLPDLDPPSILQTILTESPAVKIAQSGVARAGAELTRAHRQLVPDLSIRAGYLDNHEQLALASPTAVGSEAFAEVGLNLPLFNRNQGNIQAAKAGELSASLELRRVSLVLRQMAAPFLENYATARAIAQRYKSSTLPHARQAFELYLAKYHAGAAAYPQVLISQRTLFQLEASYISTLEDAWVSAAALQGMLLTDALGVPASPGRLDGPAGEINLPVIETPASQP